ncbi:MAG: MMPL family transporter [Rhodospirillaceae bacterium]|nr:MMPL family transporter [Rhodospirillaceae bacterium]
MVIALALALTTAAALHFASAIEINTSTTDMLAKDVPFRQYGRELDDAFPQTLDTLVVVIEGQTAGLADDAALALGARLRQMSKLFEDVFDLRGDAFFRKNGFLYLDTDELFDLSDQLADAQPFLGTLWRDSNLRGLFHMMELAADEAGKPGGAAPLPLANVFGAVADVAEAQTAGRYQVLSWSQLMSGDAGKPESIDDRRRFIIVKPRLNFASLQPAEDAIDTVRRLAAEENIDAAHGLNLRLTGSAALEQEELASVEKGMGLAAIVSLVLVLGILLAGLGSLHLVFATLVTLIMGLVWTASFALLSVGSLNLISVAFAVLFIGLSVDFGIHFGLRYREKLGAGDANAVALAGAASSVGGPLTLCALSAAISFFAFLPTDYVGLAELGVIAGSGMFIALFANLTVLPAVLSLWTPRSSARAIGGGSTSASKASRRTTAARAVCFGAGLLALISVALLPRVVFDFDPLNLKDPSTESVSTLLDLMKDGTRNHYSAEFLATDLTAADAVAAELAKLPEVDRAMTLSSFVPKGQDEKLQVIGDMALFLGPSLIRTGQAVAIDAQARRQAWARLAPKLDRLTGAGNGPLSAQAARMQNAITALLKNRDETTLLAFERRLLQGLDGRLRRLKEALEAAPVTLATLPAQLRGRWLAKDGKALVEVFPTDDLRARPPLEAFVDAVRVLVPRLSGTPVTIMEAGRTVLGAFVEAGIIAVIGICILLWVVLRRWRDVALVFVPVILAGLWTLGMTVVGGLAFNLANVIVLPLLFGLGVAGAIHLVARAKTEGDSAAAMQTSTPRAVILSALTTIGSFGSISLSSHPGTSSMGVLLMIAITMTMVATLVFLPALMRVLGGADDG